MKKKIIIVTIVCLLVYIFTYVFGIKITQMGTAYEKLLIEDIIEVDLGSENGKDINKATKHDFIKIKGIGENIAGKIVKYRDEIGGFRGMKDALTVDGIGDKLFERIEKYFKIEKEENEKWKQLKL